MQLKNLFKNIIFLQTCVDAIDPSIMLPNVRKICLDDTNFNCVQLDDTSFTKMTALEEV